MSSQSILSPKPDKLLHLNIIIMSSKHSKIFYRLYFTTLQFTTELTWAQFHQRITYSFCARRRRSQKRKKYSVSVFLRFWAPRA